MVTGGAGFIGSAVCRHLVANGHFVVNVDKLTYAGNLDSLRSIANHPSYRFFRADVCDGETMLEIMQSHDVDSVMHLAAESHVDRSIDGPDIFVETNVVGTVKLLSAALRHFESLTGTRRDSFRFHQISTDEVYGDLPFDEGYFVEATPYNPSSPYSASKAAADHFVRAWNRTYGLPVVVTNCSNNYGPFHYPEKLIPLITLNALDGQPLPVYGNGANIRDWLHVEDHARALEIVVTQGTIGETYNIGGNSERTNLAVVETVCDLLDRIRPRSDARSYREQITFVVDRPGHDRRYAIDASKIANELGWRPSFSFESGLEKTIRWFLENEWWWRPLRDANATARRGRY